MSLTIWVDADAVPRAVREVLYRAAIRRQVRVVLVANHWQEVPKSTMLSMVQVPGGADVADTYIVEHLAAGDIVISADVPLAARAVERGAVVVQPRGNVLDKHNVREHLSIRNFNEELREGGVMTGGSAPFGQRELQAFANALDRSLARAPK